MASVPAASARTRPVVAVSVLGAPAIALAQVARRTCPAFVADAALTFAFAVYAFYRAQLYAAHVISIVIIIIITLYSKLSPQRRTTLHAAFRADPGICKKGGWSLPFPSSPFFSPFPLSLPSPSPLEVWPLKPARGSVGDPGPSPGRKRILCTLKLSESCWWQSF